MKFIANIILAFFLTWIIWSVVQQHAVTDTAKALTHWIYSIPFSYHVLFWWVLFTFPRFTGQAFTIVGNGLIQGASFGINGLGQIIERLWKYRAGQIIITLLGIYLLYIIIY